MKFKLSIKKSQIKKGRDQVLATAAKDIQLKGFRKGKAPINLVEKSMGEKDIIEKTLDKILPRAYADAIIAKKLQPITSPKIVPTKLEPDKDWEFDVEIAQRPEISLGDYKKNVKSALKKIKTPKPTKTTKDKKAATSKDPHQGHDHDEHDQKIKAVFDVLLENIKLKLSPLLIEEEVNSQLTKLSEQIQKLGLTAEQYLSSMKTTIEKLREDYSKTAKENLSLEFILDEIAKDLKIKAVKADVDALLKSVGSKEVADRIRGDAREMSHINHMIEKRKTVDKLISGDL
jgi:trigger factor